jgi:Protein of unknown function (DUF559)
MPFKKQYRKPYEQPPPSPIEISFWETAKPLIPELQKEVWIDQKYRVDFLIPSKKAIIELYGYQHHNTKEKITKDAERERYLQRLGYQIIRFTGTEVFKDVHKCVNEVLSLSKIQPLLKVPQAPLLESPSQRDKKNQEQPRASEFSSETYLGNNTNRSSELPARNARLVQVRPVNQLSATSDSILNKRKIVFGMESWQVAVLGGLVIVLIFILICIASVFLKPYLLF